MVGLLLTFPFVFLGILHFHIRCETGTGKGGRVGMRWLIAFSVRDRMCRYHDTQRNGWGANVGWEVWSSSKPSLTTKMSTFDLNYFHYEKK
ncbi:hypothetical protein CEXT_148081 [Caerostris extrusa]|uniref:Secreted protein n=1 Tax=Caerostris extrusa TaxID=172846 RepID=A0AAV4S444_CAEEX|nr:hypothetical protein CEXT_148081 [Caerostris extrusa]